VAISVLAIGKIALVEMHRMDTARTPGSARPRPGEDDASATASLRRTPAPITDAASGTADAGTGMSTAAVSGARPKEAADAPAIPRTISEMPPAPIASPSPISAPRAAPLPEEPKARKKRDRDDPTPRAVPVDRTR
jgi:hypothetical protein